MLTLATCNAQYVEITCSVGSANTQLSCQDYIVKPNRTRTVVVIGPTRENYDKVTFMNLKHPALHYFLVEIFTFFPNLQTLHVDIDGSARLPQFGFQNAKNLEYFRLSQNTFDSLDGYAFYGANKLKSITIDSILRIDENTFFGLSNLTDLQIYSSDFGMCAISNNAFNQLVNLKTIEFFGNWLETIPASLFAYNLKLEQLLIFDNIRTVEATFIDHLVNLKTIRIGGSIDGSCAIALWTFPEPISQFHLAMAPCYANFTH